MTTLILALSLLAQAPQPSVEAAPTKEAVASVPSLDSPVSRRQAELRKTLEKRKASRQKQALQRLQKRAEAEARTRALAEEQARKAPEREARERLLMLEAQRTQAIQGLSAAAQQDAQINRARYQLQSQALGQSQIFVPGQGFIPYPYSIVAPIRPLP